MLDRLRFATSTRLFWFQNFCKSSPRWINLTVGLHESTHRLLHIVYYYKLGRVICCLNIFLKPKAILSAITRFRHYGVKPIKVLSWHKPVMIAQHKILNILSTGDGITSNSTQYRFFIICGRDMFGRWSGWERTSNLPHSEYY